MPIFRNRSISQKWYSSEIDTFRGVFVHTECPYDWHIHDMELHRHNLASRILYDASSLFSARILRIVFVWTETYCALMVIYNEKFEEKCQYLLFYFGFSLICPCLLQEYRYFNTHRLVGSEILNIWFSRRSTDRRFGQSQPPGGVCWKNDILEGDMDKRKFSNIFLLPKMNIQHTNGGPNR